MLWVRYDSIGESIVDRYFFLILEAFLFARNPFSQILKNDAQHFVDSLDYVNRMRNKHGAHNDDVRYRQISHEEMNAYISQHSHGAKQMIAILSQEELQDGR